MLVAARDEEQVIARLVQAIAGLDYPADRLKLWVMDDGSQDRTPETSTSSASPIPSAGAAPAPQCRWRKSGALNALLPQLQGIGCWCSMPMQP